MMDINKLKAAPKITVSRIDTRSINSYFLKQFKEKHKLSETQLACIFDVNTRTIDKWLKGKEQIKGPASVLLAVLDEDDDVFNKVYSVKYQ